MDKSKEVWHHENVLTCLSGFDILSDCNINKNSRSNLGYDEYYELPQGIKPKTNEAVSYLAGSR